MKMAIYKRGKTSRSLFIVLSSEELEHIFDNDDYAYCKIDYTGDHNRLILRAGSDVDGTKVTKTRYGHCVSKAVLSLGMPHLKEFASSTDVSSSFAVDENTGTPIIMVDVPGEFVASNDGSVGGQDHRKNTFDGKPQMTDQRLRALLDIINSATDQLGLRLAIKNNRIEAFRTVEVRV